tara:strand:- start:2827 stop:3084 length:258 start_codon:yes stop_codon:yes gene_type:complete
MFNCMRFTSKNHHIRTMEKTFLNWQFLTGKQEPTGLYLDGLVPPYGESLKHLKCPSLTPNMEMNLNVCAGQGCRDHRTNGSDPKH